ncbi:hypothetical protein LENED_009387 [Lentinula edodes]|uniref:Uncharacterized protein n=1 Tax=Lentinula edodes TaxID=5353 RepID=A0A1Q3EJJ7_LENED|nr:hypothetical protein LENED_009387 [Lentinula edodes]
MGATSRTKTRATSPERSLRSRSKSSGLWIASSYPQQSVRKKIQGSFLYEHTFSSPQPSRSFYLEHTLALSQCLCITADALYALLKTLGTDVHTALNFCSNLSFSAVVIPAARTVLSD